MHDWGWIGFFGVLLGVHRCKRCGVYASERTVNAECPGRIDDGGGK